MFDIAIEILRPWVIFGYGEHKQSAEAAIRVLEAAGRVSERDLGRVFMGFVSTELRELLEAIKAALPDKGAK